MNVNLDFLQAGSGDSFLLSFYDSNHKYNILIDSGKGIYELSLKHRLKALCEKKEVIDLLIITHIDIDHIGGILKYAERNMMDGKFIKKLIFNSGEIISKHFNSNIDPSRETKINIESTTSQVINTNYKHGITFEKVLRDCLSNQWYQELIIQGKDIDLGNAKLTVLSPTLESLEELNKKWQNEIPKNDSINSSNRKRDWDKEIATLSNFNFLQDNSLPNKSSIAFIFTIKNTTKRILFLADSHMETINKSLKLLGYSENNPLKVEMVKLSHHGSKGNLNYEFLNLVRSQKFLISTSGINKLPDKEALSRIVCNSKRNISETIEFIFNYPSRNYKNLFTSDDKKKYNFICSFNENNSKWASLKI